MQQPAHRVQDEPGLAQAGDRTHVVAHEDDGPPLLRDVPHLAQAFLLKRRVPHGQDLVHQDDLRLEMGGDGEGQAQIHAGGVVLDRRVQEALDLGEADDLVEFLLDLGFSHPEDGAVQKDVLASRQLRVEPGADLQERADPALQDHRPRGWLGDPRQDLQ